MARVREEQRAGRTPEQELRDALTAIRPLLEREDVEEDEWVAAFEKEVPILVDAAYRFLAAVPCARCGGRGYLGCDDPQHSDSTWDHNCNDGQTCPACGGAKQVKS